ncbi:MAG: hypothetical protein LBC06_01130 [Rickettsiales bacterium]|jgi:Na+-translocating ferredoxin:NAD+ oxidoreductase RnfC subunit|nr:hypothetical protein [Rickettsiales bacterium]
MNKKEKIKKDELDERAKNLIIEYWSTTQILYLIRSLVSKSIVAHREGYTKADKKTKEALKKILSIIENQTEWE